MAARRPSVRCLTSPERPPGGRRGRCLAVPPGEAVRTERHRQVAVRRSEFCTVVLYGGKVHLPMLRCAKTSQFDTPWEGLPKRGGLRP